MEDQETDEIERWFATEFEHPAEISLQKATSDARLTPDDWENIVRYLAAQHVRTPARMSVWLKEWERTLPVHLDDALRETVRRLESGSPPEQSPNPQRIPHSEYIPLRIAIEDDTDAREKRIVAETVLGRGHWFFGIKRLLTGKAISVLFQHRWTILAPPRGVEWFTTDDPVLQLNYDGPDNYSFAGGWGSRGTEIMLPLGPRHLLYTRIGYRPQRRGERMPAVQTTIVRRLMAEHAHRMIFSLSQDPDIERLRPRMVSAETVRNEQEMWRKWPEDQTRAERELKPKIRPESG